MILTAMSKLLLPYIHLTNRPTKLFLLLMWIVATTACTSIAPPAVENSVWAAQSNRLQDLDSWQLSGRVNIRYDNESHTPRIRWQQNQETYSILLWGTFNAGRTNIEGRPGYVTLEQDGNILEARTPEDLILQQLGYEFPVSYLEYWVKGLPAPASNAELTFNELNQLSGLVQDGWTVNYPDPRQYGDITLPRRVEVSRPIDEVSLRFVGLNWALAGTDAP